MSKKVTLKVTLKNKILIIGSGRWAKIYLKEILSKFKTKKIYILTNNKNNSINSNKQKKLILNNFPKKKIRTFDNIIICNKTKDHFKYIKFFTNKNKVLIEKPLSNNPEDFFKNKIFLKKKFLSLQFSFSKYFEKFKKNIVKNKKIDLIHVDWFDSTSENKNYNNEINFIEDVYYHFYSIIRIFLGQNVNLLNSLSVIKKNKIKSKYKKTSLVLKVNKSSKSKIRKIIIKIKSDVYNINFLNLNKIVIKKNNKICKIFYKNVKTLKFQILYFLTNNKKIKINSFFNLSYLFEDLLLLRKKML